MTRKAYRSASFGAWLESQLARREWNQSDFARKVGVRPAVVSRWINNTRTPNTASVDRIADALMVDVDDVLTRAGHRPHVPNGDLDEVHAQLDPYLRQVLDRPDTIQSIVSMVKIFVDQALRTSPPPSGRRAPASRSPDVPEATG